MQNWEYAMLSSASGFLSVTLPFKAPQNVNGALPENLNKLGADGWELVGTAQQGQNLMMFLKRPKQ